MLKNFFLIFILLMVTVVAVAGFRGQKTSRRPIEIFSDMDHQKKVKAQVPSNFFADGRGARVPVAGTMPMGYAIPEQSYHETLAEMPEKLLVTNFKERLYTGGPDYLNTGKIGEVWGDGLPLETTNELIERGFERYTINCTVCHGATGAGNGIAGQYGIAGIPTFHTDRLRDMPDGEIYNTIVHGKNTMMSYGHQVSLYDRWAIVAYIRVLQRANNGTVEDLSPEGRAILEAQP